MKQQRGGCLCGGVTYQLRGPLRNVIACHCSQCRRTSGHFVAASSVAAAALLLTNSASLKWYQSSADAERGFCSVCGGNLFWRRKSEPGSANISIMAGTLDVPTGLRIERHIFTADKSDYYAIDEHTPQASQWHA